MAQLAYTGRFAPSPTGPLHFGSLVGALASYLDARANNGIWLVRIEDIDPPREVVGAADTILRSLEAHGLNWDQTILYQSHRHAAYQEVLNQLLQQKQAYYCNCSRRQIQETGAVIYPGTCRDKTAANPQNSALRLKTGPQWIEVQDLFQGQLRWNLPSQVGDFVIHRRDGLFAYQLAVVVDDIHQGVTHIIRGTDLLDSTPKQACLYSLLGKQWPQFGHFPVIVDEDGNKLSKQTKAEALDNRKWQHNLLTALAALGQELPPVLAQDSPMTILNWAVNRWSQDRVSRRMAIKQSELPTLWKR